MSRIKRLLSVNQSINDEVKKFRTINEEEKSVTSIENFSNELFYEIFDYLDGCDVFDAFSNLNTRFQNFLNSPSFLFKIYRFSTTERTFERYYRQLIIPNKQRIISLQLYDQALIHLFSTLCHMDTSFNHLECLVLIGIKLNQLLPLLTDLTVLPRLVSLNIRIIGTLEILTDVYKLIFKLPFLKYITLSPVIDRRIGLLSISAPEQISTIEHLTLNHTCTLDDLNTILSYTPHLRHLTCERLFNLEQNIGSAPPQTLPSLTYMSINECDLSFDEFEIFIKQKNSKLHVLRVNFRVKDTTYIDADRWEQLISQHMPHLRKFDFRFYETLFEDHPLTSYHRRINRFTSSFWIQRQWFFTLEIERVYSDSVQIIYLICSNRKPCDFHDSERIITPNRQEIVNSSVQLTVRAGNMNELDSPIIDMISSIFSSIRITRLDIDCSRTSMIAFTKLLRRLPNVDSLQIIPLAVRQIRGLSEEEVSNFILDSRNDKLTKMKLRLITEVEQVIFFIRLAPYIKYLEIDCASNIDLEVLVQCILLKTTNYTFHQLCSLCLCIGKANDEMVKKLNIILYLRKSFLGYTIKRVYDKIYLQWKLDS